MTVRDYLNQKGFEYKEISNSSGLHANMNCPNCGDPKTFSISLTNGAYNCLRLNKCGIRGSFTDFQKLFNDEPIYLDSDKFIKLKKSYKVPEDKSEPVNSKVIEYLKKRKISEDVIKFYPIGYLDNAIIFQYHKNKKLVNIKYRSLHEKKFWKEKDCMSVLWAQDLINDKNLVITEGEIDVLSFAEYGIKSVSVPSGAKDLTWIENDWDFLEQFKTIYLALDNDEAGQGSIDEIVKRLGIWRCRNVKLPFKDANECLMNDVSKTIIQDCFRNAQSYDLAELKSCANFSHDIIEYKNNSDKLNGITTSSIGLTTIMKGWRDEELSIWTGQNSSGKSTYLSQEILHLIEKEKRVCVGSFEMPPRKYLWWLLKQYNADKLFSELDKLTDQDVKESLDELSDSLFVIDILGTIQEDKLFEIIEFAYRKYGITVFVIDSLMKVDLTTDIQKLLGEQKKFVSKLKDFASNFKSHIHLVAHPRKANNDEDVIGKSDVAGSGDITNLADNVFVLHRFSEDEKNKRAEKNKEDVDSLLFVKKNREMGTTGHIGLKFNEYSKTFEYVPMTEKQKMQAQDKYKSNNIFENFI